MKKLNRASSSCETKTKYLIPMPLEYQKERKRGQAWKSNEKIMAQNFPNLAKDKNLQIQS